MNTEYSIYINIAEKELQVKNRNGEPIKRFPVISGLNSYLGKKTSEGDRKTPRGKYYVCTINEKSKFTLFFGLSYPNREDAQNALKEERISEKDYQEILKALADKKRPPWNTPLGGEIGIHGGGIAREGTRGCIGMRDEDVLTLKPYIHMKTEVVID
jgi:murein L,D-transpeptidase YafK